jgi:death-on-curing protein
VIVGVLPKPPRFLELSELLTVHESAIDQFGGSHGMRDLGLLESALSMPRQSFGGEFVHSVPFGMAAAYAFHICKNHPFVDGNKRTALAAMVVFLRLNGWELQVSDLNAAEQILAVAEDRQDKEGLASWLAANCRPRVSIELRDFFASLTPEVDFHHLDTSAAGAAPELAASCQDAAEAMPVVAHLLRRVDELRAAGRAGDPSTVALGVRALTFVAIYRIAEDLGYEW